MLTSLLVTTLRFHKPSSVFYGSVLIIKQRQTTRNTAVKWQIIVSVKDIDSEFKYKLNKHATERNEKLSDLIKRQ